MIAWGQWSTISGTDVYVSPVVRLSVKTVLKGEDYPALERVWDNDADTIFDQGISSVVGISVCHPTYRRIPR